MSTPERIYALLVEANPVPDPSELLVGPRLIDSEPRRHAMQTDEQTIRAIEPPPPERPRRAWIPALAAAVVVLVAVTAGAFWLSTGGDDTTPVVTDPPVTTVVDGPEPGARADAAVTKAEAFFGQVAAGGLTAVAELVSPNEAIAEADEHLFAFHAAMAAAGYGMELGSCEATDTANSLFVRVECTVTERDPVAKVLGIEQHVWPWHVFDDGRMEWRPADGVDLGALTAAYADYLQVRHEADYLAVCRPAAYDPGTVVVNERLALTGSCGELAASVARDVAAWIEAGKPELGRADAEASAQEARAAAAVRRVEEFYMALNAGDTDTYVALTSPDAPIDEPDLLMWQSNAVFAQQYPIQVQTCTAADTAAVDFVLVECALAMPDPVFVADGVGELIAPWRVYDDGHMEWRPWTNIDDTGDALRAYRDYMIANHSDQYDEFCNPGRYTFGTVNFNVLALTPQCAEFRLTVADDVAAWLAAGRP